VRVTLLLMCVLCLFIAACASARSARVEAALLSDEPPKDFWLAVTVLRPVPLGALINARTEPEHSTVPRPARYVVEADAVLRAAVGYGASESTFPPQTRQLTSAQRTHLWRMVRDSALPDPDHPGRTGKLPDLDDFGQQTEGRGGYCITFSIAGERRILAIDEAAPAAADARNLVSHLASLAWIRPRLADAAHQPANGPDSAAQQPEPAR